MPSTDERARRGGTAWDAPAVPGAASSAVRSLLAAPARRARVLAAFPQALYLEVPANVPRMLAVVTRRAVRLPFAVVLPESSASAPFTHLRPGDGADVGAGIVAAGTLRVRVGRWWDPTPRLGPVSPGRLFDALTELDALLAGATTRPGLADHPAADALAAACVEGEPAGAAAAARRLVGLGPGLTPSGDDMLGGLLLSLRALGGALARDADRTERPHERLARADAATPSGTASERGAARGPGTTASSDGAHGDAAPSLPPGALAGRLEEAVTPYAEARTTPVSAALLRCAAAGAAASEVTATLRALAGHGAVAPATRGLLEAGHTSGADTAWGLFVGGIAALHAHARVTGASGHALSNAAAEIPSGCVSPGRCG